MRRITWADSGIEAVQVALRAARDGADTSWLKSFDGTGELKSSANAELPLVQGHDLDL